MAKISDEMLEDQKQLLIKYNRKTEEDSSWELETRHKQTK